MTMPQKGFLKIILLVTLSSLQTGRLQEQASDAGLAEVFDQIKSLRSIFENKTGTYSAEFRTFKEHLEDDLKSLRNDLKGLNESVINLSAHLQEQKQQTAEKLAELHTSLTIANSKLDTLNATAVQLSTESQTSTSDVECMDREEGFELYNNLTRQLKGIQQNVTRILGSYTCGGTGGWRRVVYLDMTDPSTTCPSGWQLTGYSKRTCGKATYTGNYICDSTSFVVSGGPYSRVCGRIKAYQFGGIDAFEAYNIREGFTIDDAYVSGISLTHGNLREHIWTFAAGASDGNPTNNWVCPCDAVVNINIPPFVDQDYFCETAVRGPWNHDNHHLRLFTADPLWDGKGCGSGSTCCDFNDPPYFIKQLYSPTTDNIEARICIHQPDQDNVAIELLELYVQ